MASLGRSSQRDTLTVNLQEALVPFEVYLRLYPFRRVVRQDASFIPLPWARPR